MAFFSRFSAHRNRKTKLEQRSFHIETLEAREMLSATPYDSGDHALAAFSSQTADPLTVVKSTSTTLTISWDASKMHGVRPADAFTVQKLTYVDGKNGGKEEKWVDVAKVEYNYTIGMGSYTYQLTGLSASTDYTLRIKYGSTSYGEAFSNNLKAKTLECELNSEAVSSDSIKLSWSIAARNKSDIYVEQKIAGKWEVVSGADLKGDGTTNTKTYTVTDLNPGTEYEFRLKYYDLDGNEQYSQVTKISSLFVLKTGETTTKTVELSWNAALGGTNHTLLICAGGKSPNTATNWEIAGVERINDTTQKVDGLKENTSYYFKLRYIVDVIDEDGKTKKETRYTDILDYSSPTSIKVGDVSDSTAEISWTFNGKSGYSYYIETSLDGVHWVHDTKNNTTNNAYALKNLDYGTTYHVRVRYTSMSGDEAYSAPETFTTGVSTKLDGVTENSATISWDIPNKKQGTNVDIQRCDSTLDPTVDSNWNTIAQNVPGTQYTNEYLGSDKKYFYRVAYTNTEGKTSYSFHVEALTSGTIKTGEATIDTVEVFWNFVPKAGSNFIVQVATGWNVPDANNEAAWSTVANFSEIKENGNLVGYTVQGLKPGEYYHFRVKYISSKGTEQQVSTIASKRTETDNIILKEKTDTTVTIQWAATGFSNYQAGGQFAVYLYEYSERSSGWRKIDTVSSSWNSYTYTDLLANTKYQFKVEYSNGSGVSSTMTVWTDPHDVTVSDQSKDSALLTWDFETDKDVELNESKDGDGKGNYIVQKYIGNGEPNEDDGRSDSEELWETIGSPKDRGKKEYNLTGLEINSTYYYRIVYTYRTGEPTRGEGTTWIVPLTTQYSEIIEVKTLSDISTTYAGTNVLSVKWDDMNLKSGEKYTVMMKAGDSGWKEVAQTTSKSYDVRNLAADTEYEFQILYGDGQSTQITSGKTTRYDVSLTSKDVDLTSANAVFKMLCIPDQEANFKLYYRVAGSDGDDNWPGSQYAAGTVSGAEVVFNVVDLKPETEYEFKVVYETKIGNVTDRHESNSISVSLADDLMPSDVDKDSIKISWYASSFPDKSSNSQYIVEWRIAGSDDSWTKSSTISATSYTVNDLTANTAYEFRVQYYTTGGATAYSTLKTVRTSQPPISISTPQFGQVKLTWNFETATHYKIQYKDKDGNWHDVTGDLLSKNASEETLYDGEDLELEKEKEYTFRVAYKTDASGDWVFSEEADATMLFGMKVTDNSLTSKGMTIQWDYHTTQSNYTIKYRQAGTSGSYTSVNVASDQTEYTISNLHPDVEYEIVLVYGASAKDQETVFVKTLAVPPDAPTTLKADKIYSNSVKLTWLDKTEFEENYVIELTNNLTGKKEEIVIGAGVGAENTMEYLLTGLLEKTSYTVVLYAKNGQGESTGISVNFTTLKATELKSVKISKVTTPKSITLSWTLTSITDVSDPTQFRVEYYDSETKLWYEVATVDGKTWTANGSFKYGADKTVVEIENNTSYQFRVVALGFTEAGTTYADSAATTVTAKTASLTAPTPNSVKSADVSMTSATISFKDTDSNLKPESKTYEIGYVEGKYTDWTKVDPDDVIWVAVSYKDMKTTLTGLKPSTQYSFVVRSSHEEGGAISKVVSFKTTAAKTPSKGKGGSTLIKENGNVKFASQISWYQDISSISDDLDVSYEIYVSVTGKNGTFFKVPAGLIKTNSDGHQYTNILLTDTISVLKANGIDVSKIKTSISFQVATVYSRDGVFLNSTTSSTIKVTLPRLV